MLDVVGIIAMKIPPTLGTPFWWYLVSSVLIGVGIGVLAQPSLIVRFMTVKSDKELNRSVIIGGIFIAIMPTTAYLVGSLSNIYFFENFGKIAVDFVGGNIDKIIPTFITMALPEWFVYLFLLSLIAAAMSTISAQLHTQGSAFGIDIYSALRKKSKQIDQVPVTRVGIVIAVILAVLMAFLLPGSVVALGTSLFFEICAAAFLPVFIGALYWKGITKPGAIAGIISGTIISLFWLAFLFEKTAVGLGICKFITGSTVLITTAPWPFIDIISVIFVFIMAGFEIDVIKEGINQSNEIPDIDFVNQFVKGIKNLVTSIVYFIIPAIILIILGFIMNVPQEAMQLVNYMKTNMVNVNGTAVSNTTATAIPDPNLFLTHIGILAIIAIIFLIIFGIFYAIGKCRLAKDDSLKSSLNIPEVINDLKEISIGKFIATFFVMLIVVFLVGILITFVLGIISTLIALVIPSLAYVFIILIECLIITPYLNLFSAQTLGLLYSDKE